MCIVCSPPPTPPPLSVLGEGKQLAGWGGSAVGGGGQQGVGVNRHHIGRENLEQFRTSENLVWASSKTYSLPPDTRNI
jgi:hypothetical protein